MTDFVRPHAPALEFALCRLYRRFFDQAERRRRWSIKTDIFNNEIYVREVYLPILQELGVTRPEMRSHDPNGESAPTNSAFGPAPFTTRSARKHGVRSAAS